MVWQKFRNAWYQCICCHAGLFFMPWYSRIISSRYHRFGLC